MSEEFNALGDAGSIGVAEVYPEAPARLEGVRKPEGTDDRTCGWQAAELLVQKGRASGRARSGIEAQ